MCTVKELKEFLNALPDDMSVEVLQEYNAHYTTDTRWINLDLEKYSASCNVYGSTLYLGED